VLVGHDEVEVDLDQVAEAVTGRARAERIVEREQARLRLDEGLLAAAALEALADAQRLLAGRSTTARPPPSRSAASSDSTSRLRSPSRSTRRSTSTSASCGTGPARSAVSTASRRSAGA
jgi:hypothetical protein